MAKPSLTTGMAQRKDSVSSDKNTQTSASSGSLAGTESNSLLDSQHPYDWPTWRKYLFIGILSLGEFIVPFASMMLAPSLPQVMATFSISGSNEKLASFSVTVYMIGIALGLLCFGPVSDTCGRATLTRVAACCYTVASVACALAPSIGFLIAARTFAGFFGGAPMAIGGALVADLFAPGKRDAGMASYVAGPAIGPVIGSIVGSLVNGALGWRWVFWIAVILSSVYAILCMLALGETHHQTLERQLCLKLEKAKSPAPAIQGRANRLLGRVVDAAKILWEAVKIPAKISLFPSISLLNFVLAVFTGYFNILISSLGTVYQRVYGFPPSTAGFGYIAIGIGAILSLIFAGKITRTFVKQLPRSPQGKDHKNYLLPLVISSLLACMGWLCYGWACEKHAHWIVSMVGLFFYGLAGTSIRVASSLFLVEAFPGWSSSVLSTMTIATSIGASLIPIATFPMYNAVGIGWTYSIMSLTLLFLSLIPLALYLFAERLSGRWDIALELKSNS